MATLGRFLRHTIAYENPVTSGRKGSQSTIYILLYKKCEANIGIKVTASWFIYSLLGIREKEYISGRRIHKAPIALSIVEPPNPFVCL